MAITSPRGFVPPNDTIEEVFTYHAPEGDQAERYQNIRASGKALAYVLLANCPPGPDRALAIRKVREAVMFANASIATRNAWDRFLDREYEEAHPKPVVDAAAAPNGETDGE